MFGHHFGRFWHDLFGGGRQEYGPEGFDRPRGYGPENFDRPRGYGPDNFGFGRQTTFGGPGRFGRQATLGGFPGRYN